MQIGLTRVNENALFCGVVAMDVGLGTRQAIPHKVQHSLGKQVAEDASLISLPKERSEH
jgi:hypothetical protein